MHHQTPLGCNWLSVSEDTVRPRRPRTNGLMDKLNPPHPPTREIGYGVGYNKELHGYLSLQLSLASQHTPILGGVGREGVAKTTARNAGVLS